jgi:hypothetical protein
LKKIHLSDRSSTSPFLFTNLKLELIKELRLADGHISAASGLVMIGQKFYVVCDDEQSLAVFSSDSKSSAERVQLFEGVLPRDPRERKKKKKDIESLFLMDDQLYAVPSGSTSHRNTGAVINVNTHVVRPLDFTRLFEACAKTIKELNVEGGVIYQKDIILFQRGNGAQGQNAIIVLDRAMFAGQAQIPPTCLKEIITVDLGLLNDLPLSFTDAAVVNGRIFFLAVCEASASTYEDGEVSGSVIGELNRSGKVLSLDQLDLTGKPEGLHIEDKTVYIVTDDDNALVPARLFKGTL